MLDWWTTAADPYRTVVPNPNKHRKSLLKVISFNDVCDPENWSPEDPFDFEEWITVTIGDDEGGSNFQLHVCTPVSISGLPAIESSRSRVNLPSDCY